MRRILISTLVFAAAAACTDQPFTVDVALRVVAVEPSGGSVGITRHLEQKPIVVRFSEDLYGGTCKPEQKACPAGKKECKDEEKVCPPAAALAAHFKLVKKGGAEIATEVSYDKAAGFAVSVKPKAALDYSTDYVLTITTDVRRARDLARLPVQVVSTFTTQDPPPLQVISISPGDGASGVARTPAVKVRFSEPLDCASLLGGNATLAEAFDPHPHFADDPRTVPGSWDCKAVPAPDPTRLEGTSCEGDPTLCEIAFQFTDAAPVLQWSSVVTLTLKGGSADQHPVQSLRATSVAGQLPATVTAVFRVQDPPDLALVTSEPRNTAGDTDPDQVARAADIVLQFSEPPDCDALKDNTTVVETRDPHPSLPARSGGDTVAGTWTCPPAPPANDYGCGTDNALCTARFDPAPGAAGEVGFAYSSRVSVTIAGGRYTGGAAPTALTSAESVRATSFGGQLPSDVSFAFDVEDPPPLQLVSVSPGGGSKGILLAQAFALRFSEGIRCSTLTAHLHLAEKLDPVVGGTPLGDPAQRTVLTRAWTSDCFDGADTVVVTPATSTTDSTPLPFQYSSDLTLTLDGGTFADGAVESLRATTQGGQLSATVAPGYHVEDPPPLSLVAFHPGDAVSGVERDATLVLQFSEGVLCQNVADNVAVTETLDPLLGGAAVPRAFALDACNDGDALVTLVPAVSDTDATPLAFEYSSEVQVVMSGGQPGTLQSTRATSISGFLPASVEADFTVEDPPPLFVVSAGPSDQAVNVARAATLTVKFSAPIVCAAGAAGAPVDGVNWKVTETNAPQAKDASPAPGTPALVAGTLACNGDTAVWTTTKPGGFDLSSAVTLALGTAAPATTIRSASATSAGGLLAPASLSFRAEDPLDLAVAWTQPNGDPGTVSPAGSASQASDLLVNFARPIICGTLYDAAAATPVNNIAVEDLGINEAGPNAPLTISSVACDPSDPDPAKRALATVRLVPGALKADHVVRVTAAANDGVTLTTGPVARDATLVGGQIKGALRQALIFKFKVQNEPLQVRASTPPDQATGVLVGSTVSLTFNQDFGDASFIACTCASPNADTTCAGSTLPANCNIGIVDRSKGSYTLPSDLTTVPAAQVFGLSSTALGFDHTNFTVTLNHPNFKTQNQYQVFVIAGTRSPRGANGVSVLAGDVLFPTFTTSATQTVASLDPPDDPNFQNAGTALPVIPGKKPCVNFTGEVLDASGASFTGANKVPAGSISLSFTDGFGRAATVPLDTTGGDNGYELNSVSGTRNQICLKIAPDAMKCDIFNRPLMYNTPFTGAIASSTLKVGTAFVSLTAWRWRTQAAPAQFARAYAANSVVTVRNDALSPPSFTGERDMPVNAIFFVDFALPKPVLSTSLANVKLLAAPATAVPADVTLSGAQTIQIQPKAVATTLGTAVTAGTARTVTPASMLGIVPGAALTVDAGSAQEVAEVSSVTATTFTADYANAHGANATVVSQSRTLNFQRDYTLVVPGGVNGPRDADGNYLDAELRIAFTTSKQTTATVSIPESEVDAEAQVPIVYNRDLYLPTATNQNIFATRFGVAMNGVVAQATNAPRTVTYIPVPTWENNVTTRYYLYSKSGVLDERGNPTAPARNPTQWFTSTVSAVPSILPTTYSNGNLTVCSDASCTAARTNLLGDNSFKLVFSAPTGKPPEERRIAAMFNDATVVLAGAGTPSGCPGTVNTTTTAAITAGTASPTVASVAGMAVGAPLVVDVGANQETVLPTAVGGGSFTAVFAKSHATGVPVTATAQVPLVYDFRIGALNQADAVLFTPRDPAGTRANRVRAGCNYTLTLRQSQHPNLFDNAAGSDFSVSYAGESATKPAVSSTAVTTKTGTTANIAAAGSATDIAGDSAVAVTFDRTLDPATVTTSTLAVVQGALCTASALAGSWSVAGAAATFTPAANFSANTQYSVCLKGDGATTGVKDLGGNFNALTATARASFTIENDAAALVSASAVAPGAANGVGGNFLSGAIRLLFNKTVSPGSINCSVGATVGSVRVQNGANEVYGCGYRDPLDKKAVIFEFADLPATGAPGYTVTVNHAAVAAGSRLKDVTLKEFPTATQTVTF